jgi:large subunit ribosomal protein L30
MALKIKLVKSYAGASESQMATITGLGLKKFGDERLLQDTPAIRGMVFKVKHLVSSEVVAGEAPKRQRTKTRRIRERDEKRAAAAAAAK